MRDFIRGLQRKRKERKLRRQLPETVFTNIWRKNGWGGQESLSGKGSDLNQTRHLISVLPQVISRHGISSMVDLPCGDFNWMQYVDLSGIDYTGGDIVAGLIEHNKQIHSRTGVQFRHLDLISSRLPTADLYFVRDVFVHLSLEHINAALENIRSSGSHWLLTTTFPKENVNSDILTGQWRRLNLCLPPFSFPEPTELILEKGLPADHEQADKSLGLWRISDL